MEKKETNTLSIFQRPVWVSLFALTAAISWGWAYPLIKMGMEEYQITADMTGSKMLLQASASSSPASSSLPSPEARIVNSDSRRKLFKRMSGSFSSMHSSTPPFIMLSSISDSHIMQEHVRRYSIL